MGSTHSTVANPARHFVTLAAFLSIICVLTCIFSHLRIRAEDNLQASTSGDHNYWTLYEGDITVWNALISNAYPHGRSLDLIHQGKLAVFMDVLTGNQSIAFSGNKNLMQTNVASLVLIRTVPVIETQGEWKWKEVAEESNYAEILSSIQKVGYEAIEVLFHLCVQSYNIRVDKGKQTTTVANSISTPTESSSGIFMDFTCADVQEIN
ncbi:uncharacterized protein QC761_0026940 [Podospora bellae-mahoneyi]|uniref:Uncharacterized protein n=1 Tax=Podospora bellae-mahoneyi TaxID=2093777 RepID=A0ABR0FTB2_9PEZI|nr:hypothetical protein QC761_0026940 [Podospora bellae-mahoneyi]